MRTLVTAVLVLAGCGCGGNVTSPSTGEVTVSGQVLGFRSPAPVASAVVEFRTDIQTPGPTTTADTTGRYTIVLPRPGDYLVSVNGGAWGTTRVGGAYRGDLLVDTGTCVGRFGMITDASTGRPLSGATITIGGIVTTSAADGWYLADLGCPASGTIGFNTTFMTVVRPGYATKQQGVGRGIQRVGRLDVGLER